MDSYVSLPASELPCHVKLGATFSTFSIAPPRYLQYLKRRIESLGGRILRATLPTEHGLPGAVDRAIEVCGLGRNEVWGVVNATGLGAREMARDERVGAVRGQSVLVKGVARRISMRLGDRDDDVVAIMPWPRDGCTVVGVTKEKGVWNTEADEGTTEQLLSRGKELAPELLVGDGGEFEVLGTRVGLRPAREGGPRVELERVKGLEGIRVVHAYGHSGAGYVT